MKLTSVMSLAIPDIKIIRFARFRDHRGYFTESFRKSDFFGHPEMAFIKGMEFVQVNESYSRPLTIRGLHYQWNPYVGKLVRTTRGRMVDIVLDIRKGSPAFGKAILYDMPANIDADDQAWIWVPPGFAHGNFFTEESQIEYFCTGEHNPGCEASISPLAKDIDWSLCDPKLKNEFEAISAITTLMTAKDRNGFSLETWVQDDRSDYFLFNRGEGERRRSS